MEPHISITHPSPLQKITQSNNPLRIEGIVIADNEWFLEQGLPRWSEPPDSKKSGKKTAKRKKGRDPVSGAAAVVEVPDLDPYTVQAKGLQIRVDGFEITAWLGPRYSNDHAGFFAEVSGFGLEPGAHELNVVANIGNTISLNRVFEITPRIQATSIPTIALGPGREPVPEGIPDHLEPGDFTSARVRDIHRRLPRRKRPTPAEERRIIDRLRRRLRKLRARFPDKDWIVIPPSPPISDEWRIVPRGTLEWWTRLRAAHRAWWEARRRWRDNPTDDNFRRHNETKRSYEYLYEEFFEEIGCCCGCFVCLRIVRLTHPNMQGTATVAQIQAEARAANEILSKCCIGIDIEIKQLAVTNDEHAAWLNTPRLPLLDREALFRSINRRTNNVLSDTCVNVLYADPRWGSFGPNSHVDSGTGGYVAGTNGLLELPDTTNGPVPRHVVMDADGTGRRLAHEIGHILCLWDMYGRLDEVFPQPNNLPRKEKATRAYREAIRWKADQEQKVAQKQQADPDLSEAEARDQVFDELDNDGKRKWIRTYNLMALGTELDCDDLGGINGSDCETMCECIHNNYPSFCE